MTDHISVWLKLLNELDEGLLEVRKAERERLLALPEDERRSEMEAAFLRDVVNSSLLR